MKAATLITAAFLSGCIQTPPRVGAAGPLPSPQQISACHTSQTAHNMLTALGTVLGASAGALGTGETLTSDSSVKTGLIVGVMSTSVLAATATALSGLEAASYSDHNCPAVLGHP
jgi:hypothetical protein